MIGLLLRTVWRGLIFLLGVAALLVIVSMLWPDSGSRVAIFITLLLTYCLMAYIIIPALFRLYHLLVKHDHIPLYATYGDGWASDPVNIAIIARDRNHLRKAMQQAGWYEADPATPLNSLREAWSLLFNRPYPNAPVSTLYLFNRRHDIAFQIPSNAAMSPRTRHHVRFWRLEPPEAHRHDRGHFEFWSSKLRHLLHLEHEIWIGASTYDFKPFDIRWRTGSITHGVRHNADEERDFIITSLERTKSVKVIHESEPGEQFRFRGQSFRTIFTTDGSLKIIQLK
jgi:hypothetical protein